MYDTRARSGTLRHPSGRLGSVKAWIVLGALPALAVWLLASPSAVANHSFPATYSGSIDGGGTVDFDVSSDGSAVTRFAVTNFDAFPCATSIDSTTTGNIPISGTPHSFSTSTFTGTFDATQHATGTFKAIFFAPSCTTPTRNWTATTSTPPPTQPPPPGAPPPGAPPVEPGPPLTLDLTAKKQKLRKKLKFFATTSLASDLVATGKAIKETTKELAAKQKTKVKAKIRRKARKRLENKLDKDGKAKTKVKGTAIHQSGATATGTVKVKFKD